MAPLTQISDEVLAGVRLVLEPFCPGRLVRTTNSSVVELTLMVQRVVGSIPHGGTIELFFCRSNCPTTVITKAKVYVVMSAGWCI